MLLPVLPDWCVKYAPSPPNGFIRGERISLPDTIGLSIFITSAPRDFIVSFPSGAQFIVAMDRKAVLASTEPGLPADHVQRLLTDQIAPRILAQLGKLVVHSACVNIGGRAALLVGRTGLGKSTLGASLHRQGHRLMGDDATIISWRDGRGVCQAVYPSLRLYSDSIKKVVGEGWSETETSEGGPKSRLDGWLGDARYPDGLPLAGIFFLGGCGAPMAIPIPPAKACLRLIEHAFWLDPRDTELAGKRLFEAGQIANNVPSFELQFDRNYRSLEDARQCILEAIAG